MTAIVLVGLMGAGKSSVGSVVAARTGMTFVDVDVAMAEQTGKTVRELWEQGDEPAYRHLESKVALDTLAENQDVVLAAPGGVVPRPCGARHAGRRIRRLAPDRPGDTLEVECATTTTVPCWASIPWTF